MATAALFAFGEMLLHGVTTACDFYYLNAQVNDHASATIEAARRLGIRIVLARCFYDWDGAPAAYRETIPQAIKNFEALAARYQDRTRFLTAVQPAPHSQHGATPAMIQAGAGRAPARHPHRARALLLRLGRRARRVPRDHPAGDQELRGARRSLSRSHAVSHRRAARAAQPAWRDAGDDRGGRRLRARCRHAVAH